MEVKNQTGNDPTIISGTASAPGKVIISGEHSVVYGHPVLVMAINKRVTSKFKVKREENEGAKIKVSVILEQTGEGECNTTILDTEVNLEKANKVDESLEVEQKLLNHIYKDLAKNETPTFGGVIEILINSEIPVGSGLGSSAAWGASLSASFLHAIYFILHGK